MSLLIIPVKLADAAVAVAIGAAPGFYIYLLRESRFRRSEALLPQAVDLLGRALYAGLSLPSALESERMGIAEPLQDVDFELCARGKH